MRQPIHELAPSTKRSAWVLSRVYGFRGVQALADSLPRNARVADLGAGRSTFGAVVASKRPDVAWFSVDKRFDDMGHVRRLQATGPKNLHHVAADVLNLPFGPGSFDRIYSSALMPHLILTSHESAEVAVHGMAQLLAADGEMALSGFRKIPLAGAVHITAEQYEANPDQVVQEAVDFLTLNPLAAATQQIANIAFEHTGVNWLARR